VFSLCFSYGFTLLGAEFFDYPYFSIHNTTMTYNDIVNKARDAWQAGEPLSINVTTEDLMTLAGEHGASGADIDQGHVDMQLQTVYGTVYLKHV
jgi:hypothetical protein